MSVSPPASAALSGSPAEQHGPCAGQARWWQEVETAPEETKRNLQFHENVNVCYVWYFQLLHQEQIGAAKTADTCIRRGALPL